jgi:hypothetical protein
LALIANIDGVQLRLVKTRAVAMKETLITSNRAN